MVSTISSILLPVNWNSIYDDYGISFFIAENINGEQIKAIITKQLIFTVDGNINCYVINNKFDLEHLGISKMCYPFSLNWLNDAIQVLNDQHICTAGPFPINFPGNYC